MGEITNPAEEYFKDGFWAYNATAGAWVKLNADDNGYLKIAEQAPLTGFATSTLQGTMVTALQSIQNLVGALHDVGVDELDVILAGQAADIEVKQQTAADLTPGINGWDGSAWRKLSLLWGFSETWIDSASQAASGGGDATATITPLAADYVYVLQVIGVRHDSSSSKAIEIYLRTSSSYTWIAQITAMAAGVRTITHTEIALNAGDGIYAKVTAPGDGKSVFVEVWGYKMKSTE